ncbi:FRG domain-containing protein [Caminibacter mediatlanticus TB-2]|uniref:FRG domain-containing protein n=1 Tax=Caminibacter mediatlanticus TB-2 TaxID=391592 RepID=A0ABX5VBF5_9BACT|nr:FRG domain-containing protein [Caminibacter mediatlanticus]QCT94425.1 FRG domain-containing protein [Caminibacter mediatlanticus TB-2]
MKTFNDFWNKLENFISENKNKNYIFRGQANIEWKLHTTFYRNYGVENNAKLNEKIFNLITNFEKALIFLNKDLKATKLIDIMQLARHYGLPVPLIDFTYSPYIALFFACIEEENHDGVLYLIDYKRLFSELKNFFIKKLKNNELHNFIDILVFIDDFYNKDVSGIKEILKIELSKLDKEYLLKGKSILDLGIKLITLQIIESKLLHKIHFNSINESEMFDIWKDLLIKSPVLYTEKIFLNPIKYFLIENNIFFIPNANETNKRMIYQQGCFIYDTLNYAKLGIADLEEFILKYLNTNIIKKIEILAKYKKDILKKLSLMNINGVNLFGDEIGAVIDAKLGLINFEFDSKIEEYQLLKSYNPIDLSIDDKINIYKEFIK